MMQSLEKRVRGGIKEHIHTGYEYWHPISRIHVDEIYNGIEDQELYECSECQEKKVKFLDDFCPSCGVRFIWKEILNFMEVNNLPNKSNKEVIKSWEN